MPGRGPAEAVEELAGYATWLVGAWRDQVVALAGADPDDPTVGRDGAALAVTSVVKAGIAGLNAVAIATQLDAPVLTLAKPYKVAVAKGVRQLSVAGDLTHDKDPALTISTSDVVLTPSLLPEGVVEFTVRCPVKGRPPGCYEGQVEATVGGQVVDRVLVRVTI